MEDLTNLELTALAEMYNTERECAAAYAGQKDWENSVRCTKAALGIWNEIERRQLAFDAQANELADLRRKRELEMSEYRAEINSARSEPNRVVPQTRWASITPTGPGDDGKRAPRDEDNHNCPGNRKTIVYSVRLKFFGIRIDGRLVYTKFCPNCGGLLPTTELHEGMDKNSHFAAIKRHAERRECNTPSRVESEPDDHQAQLSAINSAISAAFKAVAHLIGGDHDTDHPEDKVGQLRDLALRLEKALAAAMDENANLDWCVRRLRDALKPFADIAAYVPPTANSESKFRASVYVRSLRYARDSYELSLKKAPNSAGENESKHKPRPGTLDSDIRSLKQANRDLRHQNYLVKKDAEKVNERMAAVERSRDAYARTAQELGEKLDAAHREIERLKARINEAESQKHKKDPFWVFTDPAMPNTDKQVWLTCKAEGGVLHIVDEVVSQPCATCFFHQHGQCHHPSTSSYDPAECRTRPADACGPAGKLWAEKKAKEAPKCRDCKWCLRIGGNEICTNQNTEFYFCADEREKKSAVCGPTGKFFEPRKNSQ